jgi:hypothetical protein
MCDELGGLAPSEANRFYVYVDSGASGGAVQFVCAVAALSTLSAVGQQTLGSRKGAKPQRKSFYSEENLIAEPRRGGSRGTDPS